MYEVYTEIANVLNSWRNLKVRPNSLPTKPKQYIHYTTLKGFHAMLEPYVEQDENYVKIFPSQVQYLNDSQEYKDGIRVVANIGSKNNVYEDNVFVVCFCGKEDLLSQWKYYGQNCGIAIEFDFNDNVQFRWWNLENKDDDADKFGFFLTPYPVLYKNKESNYEYLYKLIKKSNIKENIINTIFIPYCKNITFEEEKESRIIFFPIQELEEFKTKMKYRVTETKIIPQFECKVYYQKGNNNLSPPIPIKNIMIGPGYNQLIVFNSVISMLEKTNYELEYIDEDRIRKLKDEAKREKKIYKKDMSNIKPKQLCVVTKSRKKKIEYITYKTSIGITVQMSATPFRS